MLYTTTSEIDNADNVIDEIVRELERDAAVREILDDNMDDNMVQNDDEGIALDYETELDAIVEPLDYELELNW